MDLISALESLVPELEKGLGQASSLDALEALRVDVLGRKGRIAQIMAQLPSLAPAERPAVGQTANSVKELCNALFEARKGALEAGREAEALRRFDPSVPGRAPWRGSLHPTTLVTEEICQIFQGLGFDVASGPEVEIDYYNFEALNMPPEHPARDMQDTFYLEGAPPRLLRTHTSTGQIRSMLANENPPGVRVLCPGRVFRRDDDITHSPMFHQFEGLVVGEGITLGDLMGTLEAFIHALFGKEYPVRFRPSYFPYTEPSVEVDMGCSTCKGRKTGCRVCKQTGWVEILGSGMVHPAVFESVNARLGKVVYDPAKVSGFAFGTGIERVAMIKYGVSDIRLFYESDVRFLEQFA